MHTPCSPRRMSVKGSCIIRKREESCQATRRPTQVFRLKVEVFGSSNPELPCLSRLNVDDQNDAIPREEVTRAI
jgi:hypothetical protein